MPTKNEREPIAWVTRGGKHIPIFEQGPSADETKKDKQIADNKSKATEKQLEDKYKYINPRYDKQAKTNFENDGYNNNCVMCAIAFEANMRGQDVEANPFKFGNLDFLDKSRHPQKAFNIKDVWDVGRPKREQAIKAIEDNMDDWGNGSRAIIQETAKGQKHAMNVVNVDGNIFIVNAQNGTHGSVADMLKGINTKGMIMFRTDNQSIADDWAKWAYKNR